MNSVLLINNVGASGTVAEHRLSEIAEKVIDSLLNPFSVDGHVLSIGASVGCTIISPSDKTTSEKMREADMAMYLAKNMGRKKFAFYSETMKVKADRQHDVQNCLRQALENKEFKLLYHPQYDDKGKLLGAEALLRWDSPQLGIVSPAVFIPEAEQTGLIYSIGQWVLKTAIEASQTLSHMADSDLIYGNQCKCYSVSACGFY